MLENLKVNKLCANEITRAVNTDSYPHSVILEGSDKETRLLAANEIACAILCQSDSKPCHECRSCKKVEAGIHPDLHLLKKDDDTAMLKVDEVRKIKEAARLLPNDGEKSVFIIHEAQFLNIAAQNALLKIFEEPAEHVSFVLTCASKSALLETIISRARNYLLAQEELSFLKEENKEAFEKAKTLIDILCNRNELTFMRETSPLFKNKSLFKQVLEILPFFFTDALTTYYCAESSITDCKEQFENLRQVFTPQKLLRLAKITNELKVAVDGSANHNLTLTRLCSCYYQIKVEL